MLDDKQPNRPYSDEEQKTSDQERALVGSLTDTYKFKLGGLIKKTLSIQVNGSSQHLISYYTKEDVLDGKLSTPSSIPELSSIRISPDLFMQQNFRIPLSLEYPESYGKRLSTGDSRRKSSALLLEMAHPYMDIPCKSLLPLPFFFFFFLIINKGDQVFFNFTILRLFSSTSFFRRFRFFL